MKTEFTPTKEQQDILEAFKTETTLKINAVAGSGKSSTLKLLAEQNVAPSLYVCFNKQNADEASNKFPSHTACKTVHSLAYAKFGKHLAHKLNTKDFTYVNRGRTAKEIQMLYDITDLQIGRELLSARVIASLAKRTVEIYQNRAEDKISIKHVPMFEVYKQLENLNAKGFEDKAVEAVLLYANKLWLDKVDLKSPVKCDHDTYQKLFQLSKPKLDYKIIYLDEAQDSSPVVLDIIAQQDCKKVYVGDTYQSIYAFRQAVNAMELVSAPTKILSKSFRYGEAIADFATFIIDGGIEVKGMEKIKSVVLEVGEEKPKQYTKIFRTNGALLYEAVDLISQGKKVKCEIDPYKFKSMINSAQSLKDGDMKNIKDDEVAMYQTWSDFESEDDPEIKRLVKIVNSNQSHRYIKALDQMIKDRGTKSSKYDVLLTTAHKSKGMEWNTVEIASDFNLECIFNEDKKSQQEVNLFYVACTRAIKELYLPQSVIEIYKEYKDE